MDGWVKNGQNITPASVYLAKAGPTYLCGFTDHSKMWTIFSIFLLFVTT